MSEKFAPGAAVDPPWYVAAFGSAYRDVYAHRDLDAARSEARWLLERGVHGRTLDLCCGFARHTLALRELGCDAFGLDLSAELLARSRELPSAERIRGRLVRGDARVLPFERASFGSVVMLFSSFGYFDLLGDSQVVAEISRVLDEDGLLVLDLMNPSYVRARLVASSRREDPGRVVEERRSLDESGRVVTKHVDLSYASGERRSWTERVRLYEAAELDVVLRDHALRTSAVYGDYDGSAHSSSSPRQLVVVRRARA